MNLLNEVGQMLFNHFSVQFLAFTQNLTDVVFHQNQISLNKGCSESLQSWHRICLWFQLADFLYLCLLVCIHSQKAYMTSWVFSCLMLYVKKAPALFTSEMCSELQLSENDYVPSAFWIKCDEYSIRAVTDNALSSELEHFGMLNCAFMGHWLLLVIINPSVREVRFKPLDSVHTTESSL